MPMPVFRGFPPEMPQFFRELKDNNNREWFQPRKQIFDEKVRAPMVDLVEALNAWFVETAPEFINDPARSIYRIYRDTRFSKDKTPYKDHIAALFPHKDMEKHAGGGFYVQVTNTSVGIAGGVYGPMPEQILILRTRFSDAHEEFRKLTTGASFRKLMGELHGEQLTRVPKGFPADHPAGDLLRRKSWYWYIENDDPDLATSSRLQREVTKRFQVMLPAVQWMNKALLSRPRR
jgi:uncharacterized protein (TIGR02453 family)